MEELIYIIVIAIIAALFLAIYFIQKKKNHSVEPELSVEQAPEINNVEIIPNNTKMDDCAATIKWTCKKIPKTEFIVRYKIDLHEEWVEERTSKFEQELTRLVKGNQYLFEIQSILEDRKSSVFRKKYYFTKSGLNSNQQLAVSHPYSLPLMVIAGPGTGKTFVILERIKDLILNQGISPKRILCLTFNKNAQMEMSKRIQEDVDLKNQGKNIIQNIKTYNAYGHQYISKRVDDKQITKWLRNKIENTEFKNIQNSFDSQEDFIGKLRLVIGAFRKEEVTPEKLKNYITIEKSNLNKNSTRTQKEEEQHSTLLQLEEFQKFYQDYMNMLKESNIIDFDNQIIILDDPSIVQRTSEGFDHVLVDEYQDNNYLHTKFAKSVAQSGNITIVGDSDQTINTFQGANIENFNDFEKNYEEKITRVNLNQNYRSTKTIINIANSLISKNQSKYQNPLKTDNETGEKAKIISCKKNEIYKFVVLKIKELIEKDYKYSDIAILCRTNAKGRECTNFVKKSKIDIVFKNEANKKLLETEHVTVGTVHFFKGMEYKIIFIINDSDGSFPIPYRNEALKVPNDLRHYKNEFDEIQEHDYEERRIVYVAITRAKEKLFFVHSEENTSNFITEFNEMKNYFENISCCNDSDISSNSKENPKNKPKQKPSMSKEEYLKIPSSAGVDPDIAAKQYDEKFDNKS